MARRARILSPTFSEPCQVHKPHLFHTARISRSSAATWPASTGADVASAVGGRGSALSSVLRPMAWAGLRSAAGSQAACATGRHSDVQPPCARARSVGGRTGGRPGVRSVWNRVSGRENQVVQLSWALGLSCRPCARRAPATAPGNAQSALERLVATRLVLDGDHERRVLGVEAAPLPQLPEARRQRVARRLRAVCRGARRLLPATGKPGGDAVQCRTPEPAGRLCPSRCALRSPPGSPGLGCAGP